jgi:hypothetical protein
MTALSEDLRERGGALQIAAQEGSDLRIDCAAIRHWRSDAESLATTRSRNGSVAPRPRKKVVRSPIQMEWLKALGGLDEASRNYLQAQIDQLMKYGTKYGY